MYFAECQAILNIVLYYFQGVTLHFRCFQDFGDTDRWMYLTQHDVTEALNNKKSKPLPGGTNKNFLWPDVWFDSNLFGFSSADNQPGSFIPEGKNRDNSRNRVGVQM